jgi:hypothetical protein
VRHEFFIPICARAQPGVDVRVKVRQTFTPVWCLERSEGMFVRVKNRREAEVSRGNCPPRAETPRLGNHKNPVKTGCTVKNLLEPLAPFMGVGANKFSRGV